MKLTILTCNPSTCRTSRRTCAPFFVLTILRSPCSRTKRKRGEHDLFLKRFVDAVAPAVDRLLAGKPIPLVLVGAEDVIGRVADALSYRHLLPDRLVKDPHSISADELLQVGRRLVEREVERRKSALLERAESAQLVKNPHAAVEAAVETRVDVLIADRDADVRGRWIPSEGVHVEADPNVAAAADDLVAG